MSVNFPLRNDVYNKSKFFEVLSSARISFKVRRMASLLPLGDFVGFLNWHFIIFPIFNLFNQNQGLCQYWNRYVGGKFGCFGTYNYLMLAFRKSCVYFKSISESNSVLIRSPLCIFSLWQEKNSYLTFYIFQDM